MSSARSANMPAGSPYPEGILIMISYEIEIGFAIQRLISVFHEMAERLTGDPSRVHFSFGRIGGQRSKALPEGFANLLEFNYRKHTPQDVQRLADYIRQHRIGLIFGLDLPVSAECLKAARAAGVGTVVSYLGAPMSSLNRGLKLALKRLEVAWLRRSKPDHYIFESRSMRDYGINGRGLPAHRTSVVHTGVDIERFAPAPGSADLIYTRFNIPRDRRVIVFMGHLHRRKGVHVLMQAAKYIVGTLKRQDVHCVFLGNRENEVEQFRDDYAGAESHLTFGGYNSDVPALLAGCYAGCIPSTGWDSFPMSSLEMQACGLPVFASSWQGVPETVADGETGIVVPVGDATRLAEAIVALVDDPQRRDAMSAAARRRIETAFAREHQIENLVADLRQHLARR